MRNLPLPCEVSFSVQQPQFLLLQLRIHNVDLYLSEGSIAKAAAGTHVGAGAGTKTP